MKKLTIFIVALMAIGCEKVIDVNLNSADPKKVVEGSLEAGVDSMLIHITQTSDYFNFSNPERISGASVRLYSNGGLLGTAKELEPGLYQVDSTFANQGQTYTLEVEVDGGFTSAASYLPPVVPIDSLYFEFFEATAFFDEQFLPYIAFQDPGSMENYYQVFIFINGTEDKDIRVFNDRLTDGGYQEIGFFGLDLQTGDEVKIELRSIDEATYDYFFSLYTTLGEGGPPGIAPGNPVTNLEGAIQLGYFGAYSSSEDSGLYP